MDSATITTQNGTINGTLYFDPSLTGRDGSGYRNLVITTAAGDDLNIGASGRLVLRRGDRIRFNTTASGGSISLLDGGVIDAQGYVHDTTIAALTVAADGVGGTCGNAASTGDKYTITPASGIGFAQVGRRLLFKTGKLRTRQYEIVAVTSTTLDVCTHMDDATSLTVGRQRLRPHRTIGVFPAYGTAAHHTVPDPTGAISTCTAAGVPHYCCSGVGTGTCTTDLDPQVGDAISIIQDGAIEQSAGTNGWQFVVNGAGIDPLPIIRAMRLSDLGNSVIGGQFPTKTPSQFVPDFEYNNLNDWQTNYGFVFKGIKNAKIRWNAVHDHASAAGTNDGTCWLNFHQNKISEGGIDDPTANLEITDNIGYRGKACIIQVNDGDNGSEAYAAFQASNVRVERNLFPGGCTSNSPSCEAIDLFSCKNCVAAHNLIYDFSAVDNLAGKGIVLGGTAGCDGTAVYNNWIVNMRFDAIEGGEDQSAPANLASTQKVGVTHNYISHIVNRAGAGAGVGMNWYGNLIRNVGVGSDNGIGLVNPIRALGNIILPIDTALAGIAPCTGSVNACGRWGVMYVLGEGNRNRTSITLTDLFVGRARNVAGSNRHAVALNDGSGNFTSPDFSGTVSHVTHDNQATDGNGYAKGVTFDYPSNPAVAVTWTIDDFARMYATDDTSVVCDTEANLTETVGLIYSLRSDSSTEGGGTVGANCSASGTSVRVQNLDYADRLALNFNLQPRSPMLTAGTVPAGSPVGIRAWRFNRARLQDPWSTKDPNAYCTGSGTPVPCCTDERTGTCPASALAFDNDWPADIANVSNIDTDADGVIDLHDNCDYTANPSQYDADGDGKGDACDATP